MPRLRAELPAIVRSRVGTGVRAREACGGVDFAELVGAPPRERIRRRCVDAPLSEAHLHRLPARLRVRHLLAPDLGNHCAERWVSWCCFALAT